MSQVLHILRKDLRHLSIEIAVFETVLAAYTAIEPRTWSRQGALIALPPQLFYIALAILTIRVVQTERLAGLHQFWTTRPYEWPKLFAAKALFLLLTVHIPLAVSQVYLLHRANLGVVENLPSLWLNLLLMTALCVLPIAGVAALTRSFAQAASGLLGGLALLAAFAYLENARYRMLADGLPGWQAGIMGAVLLTVIVVQYSRRATRRSLAILTAAPVMVILTIMLCVGGPLADVGYAAPSTPASISIRVDDSHMTNFGGSPALMGQPTLRLPLIVSPPRGITVLSEGGRLTLTGADGYRWRSPWVPGGIVARGDAPPGISGTAFPVPQKVLDRLGDGETTVAIELLFDQLQELPAQTFTLTESGQQLPGLGFCAEPRRPDGEAEVLCRTAFAGPQSLTVASEQQGPCGDLMRNEFPGTTRSMQISPIVETPVYFFPQERASCRGAPITFTQRRLVGRVLAEMPEAKVRLKEYMDESK